VLESSWNALLAAIKTSSCLDDIIDAHDTYLANIMKVSSSEERAKQRTRVGVR
jgi:hypothetical protein